MKNGEDKSAQIREFLINNADIIQKLATKHHKEFLGGSKFRSEIIKSYQDNHIKIVIELANHLADKDFKKELVLFKKLAKKLALDSVRDGLTIQEAVDGLIFLKQSIWQMIEKIGLLNNLDIKQFHHYNQIIGFYIDVVCSKIAFIYHEHSIVNENKIKKKLEEVVRNKDEFMGAATHELRTPVTTLKGYTQVLEHRFAKAGDETTAEYLSKMDAQINRLNNLIGDLLDVTKIESGKLNFQLQNFDFGQLVQETVDSLQQTTDMHTIIVKGLLHPRLYGDMERIGQVISNLISNAIKYSPHSKRITIKTTKKDDQIVFSVQDFGIGIPLSSQDKVFERFYRVEGSKESTFPGLGLGLYISSRIIKRHHGQIWLKSKRGKGSTFFFSLPLKRQRIEQQSNDRVETQIMHE